MLQKVQKQGKRQLGQYILLAHLQDSIPTLADWCVLLQVQNVCQSRDLILQMCQQNVLAQLRYCSKVTSHSLETLVHEPRILNPLLSTLWDTRAYEYRVIKRSISLTRAWRLGSSKLVIPVQVGFLLKCELECDSLQPYARTQLLGTTRNAGQKLLLNTKGC